MSDPSSHAFSTCSWVRVLQARSIGAVGALYVGLCPNVLAPAGLGGATVLAQAQAGGLWPVQGVQGSLGFLPPTLAQQTQQER